MSEHPAAAGTSNADAPFLPGEKIWYRGEVLEVLRNDGFSGLVRFEDGSESEGFWWDGLERVRRTDRRPTPVYPVRFFCRDLPYYTTDPAAWGALMERELARWETGEFDGEQMHRCWWPSGDDVTLSPGPWASSIGWAACLAVLAKHGITVEP